jgi:hypothetical protein
MTYTKTVEFNRRQRLKMERILSNLRMNLREYYSSKFRVVGRF